MLRSLSSRQLTEWQAFYQLEAEDAELEQLRQEAAAKAQH